jgi:PilZ domain
MEMADTPESTTHWHPERRKQPRHAVDEPASLLLVKHGCTILGRILELSLGGCRVCTVERFQAGLMVRVEVVFKVLGVALRLPGVIQWSDCAHLAGIRFADMTPRRAEALAELLVEIETDQFAEIMRQGEQEGTAEMQPAAEPVVARLTTDARKQPTPAKSPSVRVQPAPDAAPRASAAPRAALALRKQPRQPVDTNAVIHLVDLAAEARGRIADLSLGGCCIRSDERFPVGIFRRVEVEFRIEGLPFRLGGVTQALYDRHSVGIRFLDMSDRKREQLVQLVDEIKAQLEEESAWTGQDAPGDSFSFRT